MPKLQFPYLFCTLTHEIPTLIIMYFLLVTYDFQADPSCIVHYRAYQGKGPWGIFVSNRWKLFLWEDNLHGPFLIWPFSMKIIVPEGMSKYLCQTTRWDLVWDLPWEHPSPSPGRAFPDYVNGVYPFGFGNLCVLWSQSSFMEVGPGAQLFLDLFLLRSCGVFSLLLRFFKRSDLLKHLAIKNCLKTF